MTLKFKTNINCDNCIRTVSAFLDEIESISWSVDKNVPEKTLTVKGIIVNSGEIIDAVESAGFDIEEIK